MKTEAKKNLLAASLYIALAVMIVTIVCVTVLSVAKKAKEVLPKDTEASDTPTQAPSDSSTDAPAPTEPTEKDTEGSSENAPNEGEQSVDVLVTDAVPENFTLPCLGYISKGYENELPVWSATMEDYRIHEGIDVVCEANAEIYACADGTVESIYEDPLMGYAITVYHGGGLRSTYMGLNGEHPSTIGVGAKVTEGQVIGWVGDTALIECAEPTHLHFVMTMEEETVDPLNYIEFESAAMSEYE